MAAMRCHTRWRAKHHVTRSASLPCSHATRRGCGFATTIADEPMTVLVFSRAEFNALFRLAPMITRQPLSKACSPASSLIRESLARPSSNAVRVAKFARASL
jgi:hypothetical protein